LQPALHNFAGLEVGRISPAAELFEGGRAI
jgi:hypothetical protein